MENIFKKVIDTKIFDFDAVFDPNDYLYFYRDFITEERTLKEVSFIIEKLSLEKSHKMLDLACGHGRHTNLLSSMGYDITGLDAMKGFLNIARADAEKKGLSVKYLHGDMRDMEFEDEFDRILLAFTAFGYFIDEENEQVIENISKALKKGGKFCFDIINRDMYLKNFKPDSIVEKDGNFMIDRCSFDSITGRNYTNRTIIRGGRIRKKPFFVRLYNYTEIRDILLRNGLEIIDSYSGWTDKPFGSESFRMVFIVEKV